MPDDRDIALLKAAEDAGFHLENGRLVSTLAGLRRLFESMHSVPAGFMLVPIEPGDEVINQGAHVASEWWNSCAPIGEASFKPGVYGIWQGMLAEIRKQQKAACAARGDTP